MVNIGDVDVDISDAEAVALSGLRLRNHSRLRGMRFGDRPLTNIEMYALRRASRTWQAYTEEFDAAVIRFLHNTETQNAIVGDDSDCEDSRNAHLAPAPTSSYVPARRASEQDYKHGLPVVGIESGPA